MAQEWIEQLYQKVNNVSTEYLILQKRNNVEQIRELIPQIQEFVQWFFTNISGLEEGVYLNLTDILKDCETALREEDNVLMMDALEQGLSGYLEMFLSEEYFNEKETSHVDGKAD